MAKKTKVAPKKKAPGKPAPKKTPTPKAQPKKIIKKAAPKKTPKKAAAKKTPKKVAARQVPPPPKIEEPVADVPLPAAKKFKKKTAEELARINRSKHQRIFLISATKNIESWAFTVQGTKGTQYYVNTSTRVSCTCIDYRMRKNPCKHIYFIITQVAQNDELLDYFKSGDRSISKNAFKILDAQLYERLKARLEKPKDEKKEIDLKDDPTCIICFMDMEKQTDSLQDCGTCKRFFHSECIAAWKGHNPNCPLCRGALAGQIAGGEGALGKVVNIRI